MLNKLTELYCLNESSLARASKIAAQAFQNDPILSYYLPNKRERIRKSSHLYEYILRFAIRYGHVYAPSKKLEGIAAWRPPDHIFITPTQQIECGARKVVKNLGKNFFKRYQPISKFITDVHKKDAPFSHWQLAPIVVQPKYQGKGYASKLLSPALKKIHKQNLPVYLTTNLHRNVQIYQHFGFKVITKTTLPGTDISHWSMLKG